MVIHQSAAPQNGRALARRVAAACCALGMVAASTAQAACAFTDSNWDVLNHGLIFARYATDRTVAALVASTRFSASDPVVVKRDLDHIRSTLDMNGDAQITDVDAAIVARYVAGYRGALLTQGLSLGAGLRDNNDKVLAFIAAGCPAPIVARTPRYEAMPYVTERSDLLAQMNAQGARGFQYISGLLVGAEFINLYVKDQNARYVYVAQDTANTASDLWVQLSGWGARGYRLDGFLTSGTYYVRDDTGNLSFSYELPAATTTASAFLAQANDRGANGFYFVFTFAIGGSTVAIYARDNGSARYQYELQTSTDVNVAPANFVAQANAQGQRSFKFVTGFFFTDGSRNIYVKDSAQSATFAYKAINDASPSALLVAQANSEGQQNFVYGGPLVFFPNGYSGASQPRNIYVNPTNCAGAVMCSAGGPF